MAITLDSQPTASILHSPYRPMEIKVSSNDGDVAKMKCFIHLDNSATADNANNPIILDPDFGTTDEFTFDIAGYIAGLDTLTSTTQTADVAISAIDADTNSIKMITCSFTELLDVGGAGTLSDGASLAYTSVSDWYAINGVWAYDEVSDKFSGFEIKSTGDKQFLTNKRGTAYREIATDESDYLSGFSPSETTVYFRLKTFTEPNLGGSSTIYFYELDLTGIRRFDLPCGSSNINASGGTWYDEFGSSTTAPTIDSSIGSYTVRIDDGKVEATNSTRSEVVRYNVSSVCGDSTRIKFLNRLGAFEYFTFKGYRDKSVSIRKNYYNRPLSGSYSIGEGGDRVLSTDSRTGFVVYSQQLLQADREWLIEMLEGHEAFVEENGNSIPIKIRAGGTEIIKESDGLMTIKMTYEYANPNRRQHGGY